MVASRPLLLFASLYGLASAQHTYPNAAVAAAQPHLSGIFVAITSTTANWTSEQWETDLAAMQAVGMTFAVLPHLASQVKPPDAKCPLGYYAALFNATGLGECFSQKGTAEQGGTVETVLKAAAGLAHEAPAWSGHKR